MRKGRHGCKEKKQTFRDCCSERNAHLITLRQGSWAQSTELLPYFITTTKRRVKWFGMLVQNMLMSVLDMPKDIGRLWAGISQEYCNFCAYMHRNYSIPAEWDFPTHCNLWHLILSADRPYKSALVSPLGVKNQLTVWLLPCCVCLQHSRKNSTDGVGTALSYWPGQLLQKSWSHRCPLLLQYYLRLLLFKKEKKI